MALRTNQIRVLLKRQALPGSLIQERLVFALSLARRTVLFWSGGALVMLPSLLPSMYARDTAGAEWLTYCRYGFVLRQCEVSLRC
jgi:hypothetical protein